MVYKMKNFIFIIIMFNFVFIIFRFIFIIVILINITVIIICCHSSFPSFEITIMKMIKKKKNGEDQLCYFSSKRNYFFFSIVLEHSPSLPRQKISSRSRTMQYHVFLCILSTILLNFCMSCHPLCALVVYHIFNLFLIYF